MIGHSRKSFFGYPEMADRETATAAVSLLLYGKKVFAVRVHDVRASRIAYETAERFSAAGTDGN